MVYFFQQPVPNQKGWVPDLSPAAPYGEFEFIFDSSDRPSRNPEEARKQAEERLKDFNPESDYVCWNNAGDIFSVFLVISILTRLGYEKIRSLHWQKSTGNYTLSLVPLN